MRRLVFLVLFLAIPALAVENGSLSLAEIDLAAGKSFALDGYWLYQPGYAVAADEAPQSSANERRLLRVPVPQLLNRIHWWLDDSEDFKKHENERLKALGFDTERAQDGWYYLRLNLPTISPDKHVFIEFDGVAMVSRTFCNGRLLGEHKGMFSRFGYDLTPQLKPGENLLAVFVSMEKIPPSSLSMGQAVTVNLTASKVKTMSKGMYGPLSPNFDNRAYDLHGIWQPVKLVVRGQAMLDDVWFAPSLDGAEVRVEARALGAGRGAKLRARWTGINDRKLLAEIPPEKVELATNAASHTLVLREVNPALWSPARPNLYRLEVTLESEAGVVLDSWTHDVGFRTFEAHGSKLFLNGNPFWLRGTDHLPYGKNPFDPALARKLIQYLHDANIGVTRTHATPWNEAWLSAADEIGLGVSLEGIRPWALAGTIGPTPPELFAHWLMENEDVVKRARNHPSVFLYTVGNEMLLRDARNLDKWRQLSDVVKQTRRLDPARPVICSSEYAREPGVYNELLKPNGIDDGDADDLHRYNNWYAPSSFVTDAKLEKEVKGNGAARPLIGQEMSTGYPDLDTGLPVLRYTRDLLTPQAWVGPHAYPGSDPAIFLEHHRAVTKRWAERLRFERGTNTAGFMLFAAECWFSHSYDAHSARPYPVLEAVREAFAPVGLALETSRRRFFAGERLETAVFITNDEEHQPDLSGSRIEVSVLERKTGDKISAGELIPVPQLSHSETARVPVIINLPPATSRRYLALCVRLLQGQKQISRTTDPVEVLPAAQPIKLPGSVFTRGLSPELSRFLQTTARFASNAEAASANVLLLGPGDLLAGLEKSGPVRGAIEQGATAIVFSPGEAFTAMFSSDVGEGKAAPGEYADFSPCVGTPLASGLAPMDLKWWGRKGDWRVFVADTSHRLRTNSRARELIRFIPAHGYISEDKKKEQYRTVLFEIPLGRGRLWVCDLDLEASVSVDPAAQLFAMNLFRAAAEAGSTSYLPRLLSHEELSKPGRGAGESIR